MSENLKMFGATSTRSELSVFNCVQTALPAKSVTVQLIVTPSKNISFTVAVKKGVVGLENILFRALFIKVIAPGLSLETIIDIA